MNIYIILIVLAFINVLFSIKKDNKAFSFCLLFLMTMVCVLRAETMGSDTKTYLMYYENPEIMDDVGLNSEFLFYYLVKSIMSYKVAPEYCQIIIGLLFFIPISYVILSKSIKPSISILVLFVTNNSYFFDSFNIQRQYVAIAFMLLSLCWYYEKKYYRSLICYIIACGFHLSTMTLIPLLVIALKYKFSQQQYIWGLLISLIWAFGVSNISMLTSLIDYLSPIIGMIQGGKYSFYATYHLDEAKTIFGLLSSITPYSIATFFLIKRFPNNKLVNVFFVGTIYLNIVSVFPISYRMALGLTILEIILYPVLLNPVPTNDIIKNDSSDTICVSNSSSFYEMFFLYFVVISLFKLYLKMGGAYYIDNYLPYKMFF